MGDYRRKAVQENATEHVFGQHIKSLPALGLVLPDDTLVPVHLALDPVLKYATRLGELSNNLVATLSSAIFTQIGRTSQGLPNGKLWEAIFCSSERGAAVSGGTPRH